MKSQWLLLMAVLFCTPALSYPAPYTCTRNFYVATTGVDNATCGSSGSPCASIQGANNNIALTAGDCVNVAAGAYTMNETYFTKGGNANTASGYVVFKGASNNTSIIQGGSCTYALIRTQADYQIWDGFTLRAGGCGTGGAGVYGILAGSNGSSHIMVLNNDISGFGGGVALQNGDYYIEAGNTVHDTTDAWLSALGAGNPKAIPGFNATLPWDRQTYHIQIFDNLCYNNGKLGSSGPSGTHTDGECVIIDNYDHLPYPYQMMVAGNVAYNNGGSCMEGNYSHGTTFMNNSCYGNLADINASYPQNGELKCNNCTDTVFKNNIAVAVPLSGGSGNALSNVAIQSGGGTNVTFDHNILNTTPNSTNAGLCAPAISAGGADCAAILAANPQRLTNPLYVSSTDLHLQAGSPGNATSPNSWPAGVLPGPFLVSVGGASFASPPNYGAYPITATSVVAGPVSINSGGGASEAFIADAGFFGGAAISNWSGAVDTSLIANPAPQAVYQTERYGTFSYTVSGLTTSKAYMVKLHFTEDHDAAAGQRLENVSINGTQVLSNFDIFAATGAQHKAIVKTFTAVADANGKVGISFSPASGSTDMNANVGGVEVLAPPSTANLTAGPTSITPGQSSTLTWSSTSATSCTGTGFSTSNAVSGSVGVSPSATTTYKVSCTNGGTPATASVMVTVTGQTGQIENFQYLSGGWYLPDLVFPAARTTGVTGAATIRCVPAGLRNKATINNVGTRVYIADSAGHLQFAIYTNGTNMRPANLVATSSSMSLATVGVISSALSSKVQGGPGGANFADTFWFCSNADSTKATFSSVNTTTAVGQSIIGASTAGNVLQASGTGVVISHLSCSGRACNGGSSTYGTWPSSLAGTAWTEQTTIKMPMMAVQFVSVP